MDDDVPGSVHTTHLEGKKFETDQGPGQLLDRKGGRKGNTNNMLNHKENLLMPIEDDNLPIDSKTFLSR